MRQANTRISPNRRGAALIIALVLLLLVSAISATLIRGFYTDRRERDQSLIRTQAELLRQDYAEIITSRGQAPALTAESALTVRSEMFDGTFQLTTGDDGVVVEYFNAENQLIYQSK
jgi:Tfp pilus assembly protein PilX